MLRLRNYKDGFAHLGLFLLVIVLAVVGGVGYWVWSKQDKSDKSDAVYTAPPTEACEGKWFDTHTHLDEMEFSQDLAGQMKKHSVGCSLMFVNVDVNDPEISLLEAREEFSPNPGRFVLFGDVIGDDPKAVTRQHLDKTIQVFGDKLAGIGEFAFYNPPFKGTSLTGEPWPTVFDFAADNDLFVMIHLTQDVADDAETVLAKYPNTKVLVHHNELSAELPSLLKKYKNLYYTLDTTNLTSIKHENNISGDYYEATFFPPKSNSASEFLSTLKSNKETFISQASQDWLDIFEAAPDRVMWGTDVALDWHLDPTVYGAIIDFSEEFLGKLPEQYREKYQMQNAVKLFGGGVTLQDLSEDEYDKLDSASGDQGDDCDDLKENCDD